MMKKTLRSVLVMALLVSALLVSTLPAAAAEGRQIEPRYTGIVSINSSLDISSGCAASCKGKVVVQSGYKADVTVELQRDGTTIKTWTSSGTGTVSAGGTYYVTSGHTYCVVTTADVYTTSGKWVESPTAISLYKVY